MQTVEYNPQEIQSAANRINDSMQKYTTEVNNLKAEIEEMNTYFNDPKYREFKTKFNNFEGTLKDIEKLMFQFSEVLMQVSRGLNEIYNS